MAVFPTLLDDAREKPQPQFILERGDMVAPRRGFKHIADHSQA